MGWGNIIGQEIAIAQIKKALQQDTLGHAVLLEGPRGSGKSSLGWLLVQALNCLADREEPCGQCSSCHKIENGTFPDLQQIRPEARWIKLGELRQAKKNLQLNNQEGRFRILFIQEAHCLTREASASLLKTLEEPPERMKFILTTSFPFRLPDTVVSRCRRYKLYRLSPQQVEEIIEQHYPGVPQGKKEQAVRMSGGIPGRACAIMEDEGWEERIELVKKMGAQLLAGAGEDELLQEARNWSVRTDLSLLLEWLLVFFRDGLVALAGGQEDLAVDSEHLKIWKQNPLPEFLLQECLGIITDTEKTLAVSNANVQLTLENMFLVIKGRISSCITW